MGWMIASAVAFFAAVLAGGLVAAQVGPRVDPLDGAEIEVVTAGGSARYRLTRMTPPGPATQPATQPATAPATQPPTPPLRVIAGMAPASVHLSMADQLPRSHLLEGEMTWSGQSRVTRGWSYADVFDTPGVRTIRFDTTLADGSRVTREFEVDVQPDSRRTIYLSAAGDDRSDGLTPQRAVRTIARAGQLLRDDTALLLRRGDTFGVDRPLRVSGTAIRVGAFGDATLPVPVLLAGDNPAPRNLIELDPRCRQIVIEDLAFDSPQTTHADKRDTPTAIYPAGQAIVIRRCTFLNVDNAVNGNRRPVGILIRDCSAPLDTGIRSYFAWVEGSQWLIENNSAANSTREHIIRLGGVDQLTVRGNHFTNLDRRGVDPNDYDKNALNIQVGTRAWIEGNTLNGPSSVGPLGGPTGLSVHDRRFDLARFERNTMNGIFTIEHGSSEVALRDNLMRVDGRTAIHIDGFDTQFGRGVAGVVIDRNTVVNAARTGRLLRVAEPTDGIVFTRNLYIAPDWETGHFDTAGISVNGTDLSSFTRIEGNIWPRPRPNAFARGAIHYVGTGPVRSANYVSIDAWNRLPQVRSDRIEALPLDTPFRGDAGARFTTATPDAAGPSRRHD